MSETDLVIVEHVTRTYRGRGGAVDAVRDVSLRIGPGTLAVLMGPSGSGKTTLLNIIGGLDTPTAGRVAVLGRRLDTLGADDLAALRREIGFVFQSFALLPTATALENVELALRVTGRLPREAWAARARQSLTAVGLRAWANHRPGELSGGQQQRVAIARALASEPRLVLADEPNGDLDSQLGTQVVRLLRGYTHRAGAAYIVASHDPAVAATDIVYRLESGVLLAD
jgi:ABC-type lipoprotein export system ATPase subunit